MQKRLKPIVYAAFANDLVDPARGLKGLLEEQGQIQSALQSLTSEDGPWQLVCDTGCTADSLVRAFSGQQVAVFHYAGHANPEEILLQSEGGGNHAGSAVKLEDFLAQQKNLKLVVLNACSTRAWAQRLVELGVPCVIATARPIQDVLAPKFAATFYQGLSDGRTIQAAFDNAAAGVSFLGSEAVRSFGGLGEISQEWKGVPWAIYPEHTAADAEPAAWTLGIGANDPLIGIPPLDLKYYAELPDSPYVSIKGHQQKDAALFFGRSAEIRALYDWVIGGVSEPPVLLFYGQSGVGKSSLLNAGLLPRLPGNINVQYRRRGSSLLDDLHEAIGGSTDEAALAWLTNPTPQLLILDQVEEEITQNLGTSEAMAPFLARVTHIFALAPSTQARLILSFRKEYLAEIRNALTGADTPGNAGLIKDLWLERLDNDGIIQVVTGPVRSAALRQKYNITISDDDLPKEIADDVDRDSHSPIATILQILLNKLWKAATDETQNSGGGPIYTRKLYLGVTSANPLKDFYDQEQARLGAMVGDTAIDEGLELDLLYEHTTDLVTSRNRTFKELKACYPHVPNLKELVIQNVGHLLTAPESPESGAGDSGAAASGVTALCHDTMAGVVRREFELSGLRGSRARRILENRAREWADPKKRGDTLDGADLRVVERGLAQMRSLTPTEQRLVAASRRRRRELVAYVASVLLLVCGVAGGIAWHQHSLAQQAAKAASSRGLAAAALNAIGRQHDLAVLLSVAAFQAEDNFESRNAILSVFESRPDVVRTLHLAVPSKWSTGAIAYSADGKTLVATNADVIEVWDVATWRRKWFQSTNNGEFLSVMAISRDSSTLAIFTGRSIELWHLADHRMIGKITQGLPDLVETIAFSGDGKLLAAAGHNLQVWTLADRRPLRDLANPAEKAISGDEIFGVAFHPADPNVLAVMRFHGKLFLEDAQSGGHQNVVTTGGDPHDFSKRTYGLAFSADGSKLASSNISGGIDVWSTVTHTKSGTIPAVDSGPLVAFSFSADGASLGASTRHGAIGVWEATTGRQLKALSKESPEDFNGYAFSSDLLTLAVKSFGGDIELIDTAQSFGARIGGPASGGKGVTVKVAYSADGKMIATANQDGSVRLWDAASKAPGPGFLMGNKPDEWLSKSALAFSRDNRILAFPLEATVNAPLIGVHLMQTANGDFLPDLADVPSKQEITNTDVAFSKGNMLASFSDGGEVRLWDPSKQAPVRVFRGAAASVNSRFAFSPDGKLLAVSDPGGFALWDVESGQKVGGPFDPNGLAAVALAFSPVVDPKTGPLLAEVTSDGLSLWRVNSRQRFGGSEPGALTMAHEGDFSPDGKLLVLGMLNGTVKLWDVSARRLIGPDLQTEADGQGDSPSGVAFSPDGKHMIAGSRDGTFRLWDWDIVPKDWPARGCRIANRNLSQSEWNLYFGAATPYRRICSDLPNGQGVSTSTR